MKASTLAWAGSVTGIALADGYLIYRGLQSMSEGYGEWLNDPLKRWVALVCWGGLTLHLHGNLLEKAFPNVNFSKIDPFGRLAKRIPVRVVEAIDEAITLE